MRKLIAFAVAGCAALAVVAPVMADDMSSANKTVTISGQVVDLSCFLSQGAHGMSHATCATACAKAGGSLGILLKDGDVVVSIEPGPGKNPNTLLLPYIEQSVTVTGTEFDNHGLKSIAIASVKGDAMSGGAMGH